MPLTPTAEQSAIIAAAKNGTANLTINALAGCIAEGQLIKLRRGNDKTVRTRPIEALLHLRKPEIPTLLQCDVGGRFEYIPMLHCYWKGVKNTLRLETDFGEVIATPDHEFKTEDGWKRLDEIALGEFVFSRTPANRGRKSGRITIYSVQHHPFAYIHNIGDFGNYKRIHRARLVLEAAMNNLTLEEMILIVRHNPYKAATLKYLPSDVEVHHLNGDPTDDRLENLEPLSPEKHRREHNMHLNHTWLGLSKVISITEAGQRHTYDIMMPAPYHNFIVNGHVVHNCGKTSTLELIERAVPTRPILYLCFNKKIADEAKDRMLSTTTVRTFNALGHRIWAQACGKNLTLQPRKTQDLLRGLIDEVSRKEQGPMWDSFWEVVHGVGLAKSLGYIPEGKFTQGKRICTQAEFHSRLEESPDDLTSDLIDAVLTRSIAAAFQGNIDYNDQVYMPAVFGGTFPRFPLVLVDEAQDLNPVNHALMDKLVKSRVIFVGDPFQSIFGFRGAMQSGMATLAAKFTTAPHDLSVSFRCPQAIVEAARWRVPHFKWTKPGGHVEHLDSLDPRVIDDTGSVILCRNNAPLFGAAIRLLSIGRSVSVSGSDIGPKLVGLMRKLGPESLTRDQTLGAIADWEAEKLDRGSTVAEDLAACMRVFAEHGTDLGQAIRYAEHVLAQKGTIRLMTGHKAKGLEFPTVYHLDSWLCRENEQDLNLRYVIQTRAMDSYFEINSARIAWN